jgi:hypothetical protein
VFPPGCGAYCLGNWGWVGFKIDIILCAGLLAFSFITFE